MQSWKTVPILASFMLAERAMRKRCRWRGGGAGAPLVALAIALLPATAAADRLLGLTAELTGGAGWRTSLGADARAPGFDAITGGVDALVGLEFGGSAAVIVGGRLHGGTSGGARYLEAAGDLGAQLRLGERVRLRAGFSGGEGWIPSHASSATMLGGWLAVSIDVLQLAAGNMALTFMARLDVGGFLGAGPDFAIGTMALCGGFGLRY